MQLHALNKNRQQCILSYWINFRQTTTARAQVDMEELRALASQPDDAYPVASWEALNDILDKLRTRTCQGEAYPLIKVENKQTNKKAKEVTFKILIKLLNR